MSDLAITLDDVQAAAHQLEGQVRRTPMRLSPKLSELAGRGNLAEA